MFENKVKLNWLPPFQADDIRISILVTGINLTLCLYQDLATIVLWNPTVGKFKVIPPSPIDSIPYVTALVTLHGFAYDYKVIRQTKLLQNMDFEGDSMVVPMRPKHIWEI